MSKKVVEIVINHCTKVIEHGRKNSTEMGYIYILVSYNTILISIGFIIY